MTSIIDEEWRVIPGTDSKYEVSNMGQVRDKATGLILKYQLKGVKQVRPGVLMVIKNGLVMYRMVSLLVALAFVPNPNKWHYVDNIDGDYFNCRADNLKWIKLPVKRVKLTRQGKSMVKPLYLSDIIFEPGDCYMVYNNATWAVIKVNDASMLKYLHYIEGNTVIGGEEGHSDKLPICSDDKAFGIPEKMFNSICMLHDAVHDAPAFARVSSKILGGILIETDKYKL